MPRKRLQSERHTVTVVPSGPEALAVACHNSCRPAGGHNILRLGSQSDFDAALLLVAMRLTSLRRYKFGSAQSLDRKAIVATERGPVSAWGPSLFTTVPLGCNGAQNPCMVPRSQQRLMFAIFSGEPIPILDRFLSRDRRIRGWRAWRNRLISHCVNL